MQALRGAVRRLAGPDLLDQPVGMHDLVRVQEQDGEQRSLLPAAELDLAILPQDCERPEDPVLHLGRS